MNNNTIIFDDPNFLMFNKALDYFTENENVIKVSHIIEGINQIDYGQVNKFIDTQKYKPNLYGILTKFPSEKKWQLRYIGQRKSKDIKQRLYQHLVKKHESTGAQLANVTEELKNGMDISLKLMCIFPDELRHYYEERLIKEIKTLDWNIHR